MPAYISTVVRHPIQGAPTNPRTTGLMCSLRRHRGLSPMLEATRALNRIVPISYPSRRSGLVSRLGAVSNAKIVGVVLMREEWISYLWVLRESRGAYPNMLRLAPWRSRIVLGCNPTRMYTPSQWEGQENCPR